MGDLIELPKRSVLEPDATKAIELLTALENEISRLMGSAPNPLGGYIGGILAMLCSRYDVQAVHDYVKQIAKHPTFWKQQADLKRLRIP